jgi:integrase
MKVANENPWETVDLPKLDRLPVRTLSSDQVTTFFDWLAKWWKSWELPTLFFEVKAVSGCRLGDLCIVRTADLRGKDRLVFTPATTKARKERVSVLPADIFEKLKALASHGILCGILCDIGIEPERLETKKPRKCLALRGFC